MIFSAKKLEILKKSRVMSVIVLLSFFDFLSDFIVSVHLTDRRNLWLILLRFLFILHLGKILYVNGFRSSFKKFWFCSLALAFYLKAKLQLKIKSSAIALSVICSIQILIWQSFSFCPYCWCCRFFWSFIRKWWFSTTSASNCELLRGRLYWSKGQTGKATCKLFNSLVKYLFVDS